MLNCKVIYNGVEYTHESFLDFILESGTENISDIVYDTAIRNRRASQLKVLHTEGTKLKTSKHRDDINADLESETPTEKHQIGVTKFLSGLTVGDSLLFPEFIEENYWIERRKDWQKGEFSIEEKEVLFSKDSNGNYNVDPNIDLLEAETKIKEKWKAQAYLGTAIHKTLELFFKYKKDNSIWQIKDDNTCLNLIKKGLSNL